MTGRIGWSLIVPSRNGEDTLAECLDSLARLATPDSGLEIILVDNASTDDTGRLMREFAAATGAVVLFEPRHGKSHALNTAIGRARGDMLVFLDDDVVADRDLILAYASARQEFPDTGIFAGQRRPRWRARPPAWIEALAEEGFSCGCTPARLAAGWISPTHVKGGNVCFSRAAIGHLRFAIEGVNFGAGTRDVGGEDTEFVRRVAAASRIRHVPDARVLHIIAPHEMTWRNAIARYLRIGRGKAAQGLAGPGMLRLAAKAVAHVCLAFFSFIIGARIAAARYGLRAAIRLGSLDHLLRQRK